MKTILDLPKYLEAYNIIYLVTETKCDINKLFPNKEFKKINISEFSKPEQLDRYLKLDLLISETKFFLVDSLPSSHYDMFYRNNFHGSPEIDKIYKCLSDNFNKNDTKLVFITNENDINKHLIKISNFITKVNKNNSIKVIKNKYAYYVDNWK
jgi:hypothetical protein